MGGKTNDLLESEYLEADFDANRLTKPQLRSILAAHGVSDLPPANTRKEALVELFVDHIQRRSKEIKRAHSRVRPSDKGISFLDEQSQPSPKRRSSPEAKPARRRGKSTTTRQAEQAEQEEEEEQLMGRVNLNSKTHKSAKETTTTTTTIKRIIGKERRGRSKSPTKNAAKSHSESPSKRAAAKRLATPSPSRTSSSFQSNSPLAALQLALPRYADSPQSATAKLRDRLEYIASANRLVSARKIISQSTPGNKSPSKSPKRSQELLSTISSFHPASLLKLASRKLLPLLQFFMVALAAISLGAYLRFKFFYPIPYCDSLVSLDKLVPQTWQPRNILSIIHNLCIPCPIHGTCKQGNLTCPDGFIPKPNWVALGSGCVPDKRKLTLVEDMIGKIRLLLAERAGQALCGDLDELGRVLTEGQLARTLQHEYPLAEWNTAQFESLYKLALQDIGKNPTGLQLELSHNPIDGMVMLQSKAPRLSFACQSRLYLSAIYQRNKLQIWLGCFILVSIAMIAYSLHRKNKTTRRVEELVQAVLQILAEQDALNRRDSTVPSTLSVHQIRDALFFKTNARRRNRLWPLVCKAISRNSNVRESVMSIKGEQHRVWEWIGSDILSPLHNYLYQVP